LCWRRKVTATAGLAPSDVGLCRHLPDALRCDCPAFSGRKSLYPLQNATRSQYHWACLRVRGSAEPLFR